MSEEGRESPAAAPAGVRTRSAGLRMRLVIALPVLLVLMPLSYGVISYTSFQSHWDELERLRATATAARLLETHLEAMLALAIVGVLAGCGLAWAILRPIETLVRTARQVGTGSFDRRVTRLAAAPELERLSTTINEMIDRLEAMQIERNRLLLAGIPLGLLTVDRNGCVTAANPICCEMLGLTHDAVLGRSIEALAGQIDGDAAPLIHRMVAAYRGELPEGAADPWNLTVARQRDGAGAVFSFRRPEAVREVTEHLRRTDELASLGTFALGLAHQLRNPLAAVKGLGELMQHERDLPPRAAGYVQRMVGEIDRVDRFVTQLLKLSDAPLAPPAPTDLAAAMQDAVGLARRWAADHRLERPIETRLDVVPTMIIERDRLVQALVELLKNALAHTPEGGTITAACSLDAATGAALLSVRNTGPQIAEADLPRIFDPFFTTSDRATGLGLTFARAIVAQNGGSLSVSQDGAAVTFTVRLGTERAATPGRPAEIAS